MKGLLTALVAGLLVVVLVVPAMAWEFNIKGEYEFRLRYIGRTGNADLFGIAPLQDVFINNGYPAAFFEGNAVGFAGPNWYNRNRGNANVLLVAQTGARVSEVTTGVAPEYVNVLRSIDATTAGYADVAPGRARIVRGGYSTYGSDALYNDSRLTLEPELRVNPAIRVHGVYTIGGMRHKYFQNYIGGYGMGIGTPPLERYYMSQTSMNAYDTAAIGSWEQFRATIQLPIGIFSMGVKDFPFGTGATFAYHTRSESFLTVLPYGPFRWMHAIWLARGRVTESWTTVPDKDTKNTLYQGLLMTYDVASFNFGGGCAAYRLWHANAAEDGDAVAAGLDRNDTQWIVFAKYNNGRFFAALEYSFAQDDTYRLKPPPVAANLALNRPLYSELYHWFSELGAVAGPAKLRLLYALSSGPVLNNNNPTKIYAAMAINYQVMRPYQFLIFETFAGGSNTFAEDHGQMVDAYCYAARVDYAVASNLNVWGSYLWAHRLERAGVWKGAILSTGANATAPQRLAFVLNNFGAPSGAVGGPINPYVDDGYLGWELGIGADWKLLENLNMHVQWNYWQVGDWFDQAYQAVGVRGGAVFNDALLVGRSPIQSIIGSLLISF